MNLNTGVSRSLYLPHKEIRTGTLRLHGNGSRYCHPTAIIDMTGDVSIGEWTMFGKNVTIYTHDHDPKAGSLLRIPLLQLQEDDPEKVIVYRDKVIESDVWIHHGAIITMKCEWIAKGTIIGAGSIVTKSIEEEYTVWAGNPARKINVRS